MCIRDRVTAVYIKRVYNNNVVMVDDAGTERIAVGKGIAFGLSLIHI